MMTVQRNKIFKSLVFLSGFFMHAALLAETDSESNDLNEVQNQMPVIAIIMDDIGWRRQDDLNAMDLPWDISFAILPQTPNTSSMVKAARVRGKEIMLHLPMEGLDRKDLLGPEALTLNMSTTEFVNTLKADLDTVPGAVGINNHMGSLLTQHELSMHRLMQTIQQEGNLFFINSKTTNTRLPLDIAKLYDVPTAQRDVFLDHDQHPKQVVRKFEKLVRIAKEKGTALAICHPYPDTIEALDYLLSHLPDYGVKLVKISDFMQIRKGQEKQQWQANSSH
jgi:hypothetical protein